MNDTKLILLIWNILVCLLYGLDKQRAKKKIKRIRERTLLTSAFLFGGAGAMFGMVLFNHKTSKIKFRILVPVFMMLNFAMYVAINKFILKF